MFVNGEVIFLAFLKKNTKKPVNELNGFILTKTGKSYVLKK